MTENSLLKGNKHKWNPFLNIQAGPNRIPKKHTKQSIIWLCFKISGFVLKIS